MFKDGQTNVHDEERSGQPSVVSNDLVQTIDQTIYENQRCTISQLLCEFPFTVDCCLQNYHKLRCHQFYARWVPKILAGAHKMQRVASALTFFRAIPQRW
jgi:hypothetical protein